MKKLVYSLISVFAAIFLVACGNEMENESNNLFSTNDSSNYKYDLPDFISDHNELEEFENVRNNAETYNDEQIKSKITEPIDTSLREYSSLEVSVSTSLDQQSDEDIPNSNSETYYKGDLDPVEARELFVLNQRYFSSNDHINELVFDTESKILHIKFNEENMGNRILGYMNGNKDDFLDYHNSEINRIRQTQFVEHGLDEYVFYLYDPIEGKHVVTTDGNFVPELPFEEDEGTKESNNQDNDSIGNLTDLIFDINSPEVFFQLIGTDNVNTDGNFEQNVITIGMSQTEVEELYRPYDFSVPYQDTAPAFYGNLAVIYSEQAPYGDGTDASLSDINPDKNIVESVYFYAGVTEEQMMDALGEPDEQNDGSKSMNSLPYYVYNGTGEDFRYYITEANTIDSPFGERIGIITREVFDENPSEDSDSQEDQTTIGSESKFEDDSSEEIDNQKYEAAITEYLYQLPLYYNYETYTEIFDYLKEGTPAYDKVKTNKSSGHFGVHATHEVIVENISHEDDDTVELNVSRVYSHENSNGERLANVNYIMDAETFEIIDFEQVSDETY